MKKYFIAILIPISLVAFWAYARQDNQQRKQDEQIIAEIIADMLNNGHYSSKTIDDEVSRQTWNIYLERLDFNKHFFLQEDIRALEEYRLKIDDEVQALELKFYFKAVNLMTQRVAEVEAFYQELLEQPFNFNAEEYFESDPEKRDYFQDEDERRNYWRRYCKYLTMNRLANKLEKQEKDKNAALERGEDFEEKSLADLEIAARKQVIKNLKQRFKRRKEVDDEDQFAVFMNSLASAFGPHSEYFPPQERENFNMRMTGRLEGIGAQLTQENEYIKVVKIVPGSASWRQGDLKANDLILKVAQGEEEPVDIVDATMKEAISLIRGPKGTEVRLTVQKPDGRILTIPIIRDVVVQEETYAKSALIKNKDSKNKYGYIYLPSFYSRFGQKDGRSSAEDIRTEVLRVQKEGVDGIILDLRNNGGGSLQDAIDMAGHFISEGPIVQVKDEHNAPRVYSDRNSAVTYDGPLIVMINGFSASASEILAAALYDYERAIIVGTPSFGKGTVQTMIDMNGHLRPDRHPSKRLGSFKLTIQQFYRVNGASTQLKGVRPHIYLPNEYSYMETGIKAYDNPLPWDSVRQANYVKWTKNDYDIASIRKGSAMRVAENPIFKELANRNSFFKEDRNKTLLPLNLDFELGDRKKIHAINDSFDDLIQPFDNLKITSLQQFNPEVDDKVKKERRKQWEKNLTKDFYLEEVTRIMDQMIK